MKYIIIEIRCRIKHDNLSRRGLGNYMALSDNILSLEERILHKFQHLHIWPKVISTLNFSFRKNYHIIRSLFNFDMGGDLFPST